MRPDLDPPWIQAALFNVPPEAYTLPPAPEQLTRRERRRRLVEERIRSGEHPLGRPVLLHDGASRDPTDHETGPRCGSCRFRVSTHGESGRSYPKCFWPDPDKFPHPRASHSDTSDIRAWWPACRQYEAER